MSKLSFEVLRLRDFRLILLVRVLAMMALLAQDVIIGWQVYSLTKDPLMLGLIGLTEAIPAILCALFAGHFVDIGRPHRIFMIVMGVMVSVAVFLLLIGGEYVAAPGGNILPWLFGGVFVFGLARSFIAPCLYSLLSQIVPREKISAATGWLSSGFQFATIIGPAIAGLIYGGYDAHIAWIMPAGLLFASFVLLGAMSAVPKQFRNANPKEPAAKRIKEGWRFILDNPVLLSVMVLDMFAVLFGGAVAMLPAFADQVLHVGSEGLGMLRAAPALGAIVVALILAVRPFEQIRAAWLLWVIAGFGVCMIGFGLSTIFWVSMVFLALSGAFDSVSMVIRGTLMQWLTPDHMRGRVSSVNSMFIISSNEIGAFESGVAAKFMGLVPSVVFGGVCTLIVVGATAWFSPKLRKITVRTDDKAE
jgi:MFS family permease